MQISSNPITAQRKEATAITVMRCMLTAYADEKHLPFDQVLLTFSQSQTYEALFDLSTDIWKEGPAYLRGLYNEETEKQANAINIKMQGA